MKIHVLKRFSTSEINIEVEDSDEKRALMKALVFTVDDCCDLCGSTQISWAGNKAVTDDGDYIYIKRICQKCKGQSSMGDYKGGGHFWK